ncbi:MAG TPA: response regulator [Polyangiaceae bacterium]|jgi:CheY-like chemotaxis protein
MAIPTHDDDKRKPLGPSVRPAASASPNAPVLLVVEDDEAVRLMLAKMLGQTYKVFAVADGVAALDLLAQIEAPAAFVLDVMMPQIDGFALAKRIKADPRLQAVPILYLTAKTGPLDVIAGINAGARHYVTKPFKMPDLLARLGRMVGARV